MHLPLDRLRERLEQHVPAAPREAEGARRAAVAVLLREEHGRVGPEVLLMKRAVRTGDRWSGQIGLPGGHEELEDPDLVATAVRETREEVGLTLDRDARLLGRLTPIQARARARRLPMFVHPYVFLELRPAPVVLGVEAETAFWLPLREVARGALDAEHEHRVGEVVHRLPSWAFGEHVVWGMTHRMLSGLLELWTRT